MFRNWDKGTSQKHPNNTHNKRSLIRPSHVCHRRRAAGRNQQVEDYKHSYTHTHTHTHTHEATKIVLEWKYKSNTSYAYRILT